MIVEDHDMSDRFFAFGDGSRRDHEDSLLFQRCAVRQPVGSSHHHSFLRRSKIDISRSVKFLLRSLYSACITAAATDPAATPTLTLMPKTRRKHFSLGFQKSDCLHAISQALGDRHFTVDATGASRWTSASKRRF
jgi:hypothetical protein